MLRRLARRRDASLPVIVVSTEGSDDPRARARGARRRVRAQAVRPRRRCVPRSSASPGHPQTTSTMPARCDTATATFESLRCSSPRRCRPTRGDVPLARRSARAFGRRGRGRARRGGERRRGRGARANMLGVATAAPTPRPRSGRARRAGATSCAATCCRRSRAGGRLRLGAPAATAPRRSSPSPPRRGAPSWRWRPPPRSAAAPEGLALGRPSPRTIAPQSVARRMS
jgi:hypothetical protein